MLAAAAFGIVLAGVGAATLLIPPAGPTPPEPGFSLEDVSIVDPGRGTRFGQSVRGGAQITAIEPSRPGETGPYAGSYVLPGLIDLHVHHPPRFALGERELYSLLFLAHGVTTVRDAGSVGGDLRSMRRRLQDGETAGPRLFVCGPPLDSEPTSWSGARVIEGPIEARDAVHEQATARYDCIKIYNGLDSAALRAAEDAAAKRGLQIVGHVPELVPFAEIRRTEVQHLMGLVHSRWDEVPELVVQRYVDHSVAAGLTHVPTLVTIARWAELDSERIHETEAARLLPPHYREWFWNPRQNPLVTYLAPSQGSEAVDRLKVMRALVRQLHARGVPILPGTDTLNPYVVPGASLLEELDELETAGLPIDDVLAAATRGAARALDRRDLGRVEVGAAADLLVLAEDPSRDLDALKSLRAVVVGGRLYSRATLDDAIAEKLAHWERPSVRSFWNTISRAALAWVRFVDG